MSQPTAASVARSIEISAPPEAVWALVSDLPRMGEYSPENAGGRWVDGDGPRVGATFKGANRNGIRRWSTLAKVTRCEPGVAFAFQVSALGLTAADWSYQLEKRPGGCAVTETWTDRRGRLLRAVAGLATGTSDRAAFTETSIEQTLAKLKARAEKA